MSQFDIFAKPFHYNQGTIEPKDYIEANRLPFNLANVVKYVTRAPYKTSPTEDLRKAKQYLIFEIEYEIQRHEQMLRSLHAAVKSIDLQLEEIDKPEQQCTDGFCDIFKPVEEA
jgi:hypothetical protein